MSAEERLERARLLYERAVFGGDPGAVAAADGELDAVEAALALARGRLAHARFLQDQREDPQELVLFQRARELHRQLGDVRGVAESEFWVGCFHQVVRHDHAAAFAALERSAELATSVGDKLTLSYALRHLGFAEHAAGRLDAAQERLEESTRLRRDIGFLPGVAMNLIGLAYLAAGQGRREQGRALLAEASALAQASGSQGVLQHVQEAQAAL